MQKQALEICANRLCKRFKKNIVLENVSFEVGAGDFFLLQGPNGSGKTTLLKIIAGLLNADSGVVRYGNKSLDDVRIGYVPQVITPIRYLTGRDILIAAATLHGVEAVDLEKRITDLTCLCGLKWLNDYSDFYSFGMLKRLTLAMALLNNPQILLLDEALEALDLETFCRIMTYLKEKSNRKQMTIVLATHKAQEYTQISNGTLILGNGEFCSDK